MVLPAFYCYWQTQIPACEHRIPKNVPHALRNAISPSSNMAPSAGKSAYAVVLMVLILACVGMLAFVTVVCNKLMKKLDSGAILKNAVQGTVQDAFGAAKRALGAVNPAGNGALMQINSPQQLQAARADSDTTVGVVVSGHCPYCTTMTDTIKSMQLPARPRVALVTKDALAGSDLQISAVPAVVMLGKGSATKGPVGAMGAAAFSALLSKVAAGQM
jgi:protein-disulfide isomerase